MKTKNIVIWIILFIMFLPSCEEISMGKKENYKENVTSLNQDELDNALRLVRNFGNLVNNSTKSINSTSVSISLDEVKTLRCDLKNTKSANIADSVNLYTFILEREGKKGFAIACGDKRIADVFAYVEEGSIADTAYIKGMSQMISQIPDICMYELENCEANDVLTKCGEPDYMQSSEFGDWVLLKTEWSQDQPYNWKTPAVGCPNAYYYYAGCGAIAIAQIVAYYKKCNQSFDFDALTSQPRIYTTSTSYLTNEVSRFVEYIAKKCRSSYNCDETITYFNKCVDVFDEFGYDYEIVSNYDSFEVGHVVSKQKLLECVEKNNVVFAFGVDLEQGGHFWVIDGYIPILTKCDTNKIHCNWGWGGVANGWYTDTNYLDMYRKPHNQSVNFEAENKYCYLQVNK